MLWLQSAVRAREIVLLFNLIVFSAVRSRGIDLLFCNCVTSCPFKIYFNYVSAVMWLFVFCVSSQKGRHLFTLFSIFNMLSILILSFISEKNVSGKKELAALLTWL